MRESNRHFLGVERSARVGRGAGPPPMIAGVARFACDSSRHGVPELSPASWPGRNVEVDGVEAYLITHQSAEAGSDVIV